ncbi:MAG: DUF4091 domain-containing protein [Armatimonadetes bacterium]|nr:DUF4091 domain-containing protein [Armatimonadota bacterium]
MALYLCLFLLSFSALAARPVGAAIAAYTADGLTRIRPDDPPKLRKAVSLKAARNEYEPFQIVIHGGPQGLKEVNVQVSGLRGPEGRAIAARNIALYREHYIRVVKPSPKSTQGAGWYPDALIPFVNPVDGRPLQGGRFTAAPFDVEPGKNQPIWADAYIPANAKAGDYRGTVTVTARGEKPVKLALKLTVWDFTLPQIPSMRSNFGGFGESVAKAHKVAMGVPEFVEIEKRYAAVIAAHRLCPPIPYYLYPSARPDGSVETQQAHPAIKERMEGLRINGFPLNLIGEDPLGKGRERNIRYLRAMYDYLKQNGWEKYAYIYILDEPNDAAAYEEVRQRAKLVREAQPGIEVLCTEQAAPDNPEWGALVGSVDIWVPLWPLFSEKADLARLAAGEELWSYTALCQGETGKDTPFWQIDFPLLNYRIPMWTSWRYGITGLLYWTTAYWDKTEDIWTNPLTIYDAYNGEGSLFYPGSEAGFPGPVASMRLKALREGLEDYEYLNLLSARGDKAYADRAAGRTASGWFRWETDPSRLYAAREAIARRIMEKN